MMHFMIALKNITAMRRGKPALNGVSLTIRPKECICVASDETEPLVALFRILATIEKPTEGSVEVDNVDVSVLPPAVLQLFRSRLGLVFDPPLSIGHLTVGQNVALPLHLRGLPPSVITKATDDLLKRCGLTSKASLFPRDVSEEDMRMMCIARCVISAPLVIVAHEPFRGLSEKNAAVASALFQNLRKKGATLIFLSASDTCARIMGTEPVPLRNGILEHGMQYVAPPSPAPTEEAAAYAPPVRMPAMNVEKEEDVQVRAIPRPMPPRTPDVKEARKIHITSIGSGL